MHEPVNKTRKMELLAPAGSFDSARAAVNAGADAVYMGGPLFSARAYAESSGEKDMLLDTIAFCHLRGVRVYMTLNILMKNSDMKGLEEYVRPYADAGLDAVIIQDLGVLETVRRAFPRLPVFASTQSFVTGPRYAAFLKELGVSRMVTARELDLGEIRGIVESGSEVEAFGHGALCYSYSGQCLMSSFIGGRSGNRGRCAGTCRLPYEVTDEKGRCLSAADGKYMLSMKDLNTLRLIPGLIEAGVCSLKIEGRMKSPVYVAGVISVYRKYIDLAYRLIDDGRIGEYSVNEKDNQDLAELFDRGGFTDGYFRAGRADGMICVREKSGMRVPDRALTDMIRERYIGHDILVPASMKVSLEKGHVPVMELKAIRKFSDKTVSDSVTVTGECAVSPAENRPVTEEGVRERLERTGESEFTLVSSEVHMDKGIFIPMGELSRLRRKAFGLLKEKMLGHDIMEKDYE